jgi:hypothetical protein
MKKKPNNTPNLPDIPNAKFQNANQAYMYHKYKISILKKCIKLSTYCNLELLLTIIDPNQNYTFYSSKLLPQEFIRKYLISVGHKKTYQIYTNKDV